MQAVDFVRAPLGIFNPMISLGFSNAKHVSTVLLALAYGESSSLSTEYFHGLTGKNLKIYRIPDIRNHVRLVRVRSARPGRVDLRR